LAIGAIVAAMWSGWRLSSAGQTLIAARDAALHAEAVTDGYRDGHTIIYYYSTSGEPGALLFSSHWSAHRHADLIVRRVTATLCRLGRGAPYRKGSQRLTADDLRPALDSGNLFFRAGPNHRPEEFQWQTILAGREGLHRALSPDEAPSPD